MAARKFILLLLLSLCFVHSNAQDSSEIIRNARGYMQNKEYEKAISLLKESIADDSTVLSFKKELFWCYYKQDSLNKSLKTIQTILKTNQADDQCFQMCGYIFRALGRFASCDSILKIGLTRFPNSGPLYNDLGERLAEQKNILAIKCWENGIQKDPNFGGNYFNASLYYFNNKNPFWALMYGEIYVNLSPLGDKSITIRKKMLEVYKNIFANIKQMNATSFSTPFAKKYLTHLFKQEEIAKKTLSLDDILMARTRFLLDWYNDRNTMLPFRLFEMHRELLQRGLFTAYHQWMFGLVDNTSAYQRWKELHADEDAAFERYRYSNNFRIPIGQYYR